jgi:5-methyltetrahydrofolate--homocysteine methyltransferase
MLVIAERINATRKGIRQALLARDEALIRKEAREQAAAGAAWLDVNAAADPERELELMEWLLEVVQAEVKIPLAIDSASPAVIEAGLKRHRNGQALVNSITLETGRYEKVLPLVRESGAAVIGLALDDRGIGKTAADRLQAVERMVEEVNRHRIPLSDLYVDPMVLTVSSDQGSGRLALEALHQIKARWPEVKTTAGLSNVSFGLPGRPLLNRTFLAMLLAAGLDSAIVDPLDKKLMSAVRAAETLLGQDPYCGNYLKAFRAGGLES